VLRLESVSKIYPTRAGRVAALDDVSLRIDPGEFVVVRGPSGSGKTTLLLTIGAMLRPTSGRMLIGEEDIYAMGDRARGHLRASQIGFVFQMFHLVPYLTVVENVLLPAAAKSDGRGREAALELLRRLGLSQRVHHNPTELSAGERQRLAIARAMVTQPKLILADEPTGNLDPDNAAEVIGHLSAFHRDGGTVVFVTHGTIADDRADRIYRLQSGRLADED
jgi:putative ABC transport system ATP-binding protein